MEVEIKMLLSEYGKEEREEREEEIFFKELLKKYHTENSKKEIKRKKINPSVGGNIK